MILESILALAMMGEPDSTLIKQPENKIIVAKTTEKKLENALNYKFKLHQNLDGNGSIFESWFNYKPHKNISLASFSRFKSWGGYFGKLWVFFNTNDFLKNENKTLKIRDKSAFIFNNEPFTSYVNGLNIFYKDKNVMLTGTYYPIAFNKEGYVKNFTSMDFATQINLPLSLSLQGYGIILFDQRKATKGVKFSDTELGIFYQLPFVKNANIEIGYMISNGINSYNRKNKAINFPDALNKENLYQNISIQVSKLLEKKK